MTDMYSSTLKNQGEFFHRYVMGLYECLDRIFNQKHPNVLLEGCSSGGNRFDLGMLCYAPQIWTSDDTDAMERIEIQRGMYCFYPPSCISNHVSMTPNQQTLRDAPLGTRFNVAAFGTFGYELDFGELTPHERKEISEQIAFYKAHRKLFQYGRFKRYYMDADRTRESWQMTDGDTIMASVYDLKYSACDKRDYLRIIDAKPGVRYTVDSIKQYVKISRLGGLIKHVLPVKFSAEGFVMRTVNKFYALPDGSEHYEVSGEALSQGLSLASQYIGTGYSQTLRVLSDFGSTMYKIEKKI
jgi:alpha-galactosidase